MQMRSLTAFFYELVCIGLKHLAVSAQMLCCFLKTLKNLREKLLIPPPQPKVHKWVRRRKRHTIYCSLTPKIT